MGEGKKKEQRVTAKEIEDEDDEDGMQYKPCK